MQEPSSLAPSGHTSKWPWHRDQIWGGQGFVANPTPGAGPGSALSSDGRYSPEARTRTATRVWAGTFGTLALLALAGVVWGEDLWAKIGALFGTVVLSVPAAIALHTMVANGSRRVDWDADGLADASYFGVRRVPWTAISTLKRVNSALARQASYDRARGGVSRATSATLRPRDIWAWHAFSPQGHTLIDVIEPDRDESNPGFHALVRRLEQHAQTHASGQTSPR